MNNYMYTNVKNFRNLIAWQKAKSLRKKIYMATESFPNFEKNITVSQILRSCNSISANIAEGCGQMYKKKEITYYNTAIGSTSETRNWLDDALESNYITQDQYNEMDSEAEEILKLLHGLIKKIRKELS